MEQSGWPARIVVLVQLVAWCAVGALLLHMGLASLRPEAGLAGNSTTEAPNSGQASDHAPGVSGDADGLAANASWAGRRALYRPSSVLMVTVGSAMLVLGPVVLMIREIESRRHHDRCHKVDPPPSYDEVTEAAPRYSTLFEVDESGELVPVSPPPLDSPTSSPLLKPRWRMYHVASFPTARQGEDLTGTQSRRNWRSLVGAAALAVIVVAACLYLAESDARHSFKMGALLGAGALVVGFVIWAVSLPRNQLSGVTDPRQRSDYRDLHIDIPPPADFFMQYTPPPSYEDSKPVVTPPPTYSAAIDLSGSPPVWEVPAVHHAPSPTGEPPQHSGASV
ncbi:uncharacterized protein LOC134536294 [Bacillus rossius redtenbacheri]|uniref:uncharacterized protein LOC134536294 n=1 Tax=Bacillus rossius redtenbacheri TaxID=93214 RepID=UPI002FDD44D1